jgi:CelD/BcsL family acetyltransferase involved in cellulose biosynthesis
VRRLSILGTGCSDYLDILATPGREDDVVEGFYKYLAESSRWDAIDLQQLREGGLLRACAGPADGGPLRCVETDQERCPYLALPPDWESLTKSFGKKTRSNIGYYDRALQKSYAVAMGCVAGPDEADSELSRLFALHSRRWNKRLLPGVFVGRRVQRFHRELSRALLARGWLRLFYLRLDGVTQASLYCFSYGGRMCYYQAGFDPAYARFSPGTVLTAHAMRAAIDEGCTVFDLLRGDEPYKAKWTQTAACNSRRLIVRSGGSAAGRAACGLMRIEERIEKRVKAWAQGRA